MPLPTLCVNSSIPKESEVVAGAGSPKRPRIGLGMVRFNPVRTGYKKRMYPIGTVSEGVYSTNTLANHNDSPLPTTY